MTAKEQSIGFIKQEGILKIPFFQRAYIWETKHWEKIWIDLYDSYDQNHIHFLGSIIIKQLDVTSGSKKECFIIDGQQRLTTFSILLKVLGEYTEKLQNLDLSPCLFRQEDDDSLEPKILHSRLDRNAFRAIILSSEISNKNSKLIECYTFFQKKVSDLDKTQATQFMRKLLDDKLWVVVDIQTDEDEQRIFDSINTSGQPLAGFDIVKNTIFACFEDEKEAEKIYTKLWIPVFEKNNETKEFWDEDILTGRSHTTRSDIFLHNFAIIEDISDKVSELTNSYKNYAQDKNKQELENFIKRFTEYAEVFKTLPFFHKEEEYEYSNSMKRFLHIVHTLQLSTLIPLSLFLELAYQQNKITKEDYNASLQLFEKYIIRRALNKLDTSGYNKTVYNIIRELANSTNIYKTLEQYLMKLTSDTDKFPTAQEMSEITLQSFDTRLAKILLFWIELKKRQEDREFCDSRESLQYNFQLEHLMPRSWSQYWILPSIKKTLDQFNNELLSSKKISKSIYNMADYEFIDQMNKLDYDGAVIKNELLTRNKKIHEIGNYTLLSGRLNNSLKNYEWQRKLDGEGNKKGIRYFSSLALNRELCDKYTTEWTEDTITKRTQTLKNHILEIW